MKLSKYIYIEEIAGNNSILYNYSNDLAIVVFNELKELLLENRLFPDKIKVIHPSFYEALCDRKILIPNCLLEEKHKVSEIRSRLCQQHSAHIIINPTMDCNLRCWYCYEPHLRGSYVSNDMLRKIELFISRIVNSSKISNIDLSFFGGEPLMKFHQTVLPLLNDTKILCERNKVKLSLSFTSNGVLLSKRVVDKIIDMDKNCQIQIPFDGNRKYHNRTKIDNHRSGTYDVTLKNILYALECGIRINIRCNYTDENVLSFKDLLDDLAKLERTLHKNLHISLQRVWQNSESQILSEKVNEVIEYAIKLGLMTESESMEIGTHCYADYENSYVINYDGNVFKCTAREFSEKNSIGKLGEHGEIILKDRNLSSVESRFKKPCYSCIILPICTICHQRHFENDDNCCPNQLSEVDKLNQIRFRLHSLYKSYLT